MQPDRHLLISTSSSSHHPPSKPIPPPLSLLPLSSGPDGPLDHDHQASDLLDHNMTARCSQFPPDILDSRPSLAALTTARYQPYLSSLKTDPSPWPDSASSSSIGNQSFRLDSPRSTSTNELSSSCSSSAPPPPPPTFLGTPLPPTTNNSDPANIKFDSSSDPSSFYTSPYNNSSTTPHPYQHTLLNPDFNPHHIHVPPPQPRHSLPLQYSTPPLVPPATAFTPSGGSPPLLSHSLFNPESSSRRHTVSAFMPPSAFEMGLLGRHDMEETIIKDEKRRRNKESSQRFRDRTRERQREKQERLEYLERRIKDLEIQLKQAKASSSGALSLAQHHGPPPLGQLVGANETALSAMQRLQRENESLRMALETAEQEIHRLRPSQQTMTPSSTTTAGAFNVGQVYSSLPQLSPSASGRAGQRGGSWSESDSSPSAEPSTYFPNSTRTSSPASDSCPPPNSTSQRFLDHGPPPPAPAPPPPQPWDAQQHESVGLLSWSLDPNNHPPHQPHQLSPASLQAPIDQFR